MNVENELRHVVASLKNTLHRAGLTQREVSRRLGLHENYLSQVLAGKARLKEGLVFCVLREAGVAPEEFYSQLRSGRATPSVPLPPGPISEDEARSFIREALAERSRPTAARGRRRRPAQDEEQVASAAQTHSQRVASLLRQKMRAAGLRQREVSARLGEHPDYLSQVLRGNVTLKAKHVLGVLAVLGTTPGEFYAELYRLPSAPRVSGVDPYEQVSSGGVTWGQILALIDEELEATSRSESDEAPDSPRRGKR